MFSVEMLAEGVSGKERNKCATALGSHKRRPRNKAQHTAIMQTLLRDQTNTRQTDIKRGTGLYRSMPASRKTRPSSI